MRVDDSQRHAVLCAVQRVLSAQFLGQKFNVTAQVHEADCGTMTLAHVGILSDVSREERWLLSNLAKALVQACGVDVHLHPMRDVRLLHPDPRHTTFAQIKRFEGQLQVFARANWGRLIAEAEAYRDRRRAEAMRLRAVCCDLLGTLVDPVFPSDPTRGFLYSLSTQGAALWNSVRKAGLRIGVCANVSEGDVAPMLAALSEAPDAAILSCQVGLTKPDPAIYARVMTDLMVPRARVLFVGPHPINDIDAPRKFGMQAYHPAKVLVYLTAQVESLL